jgi:hypothetical protein
MCLIAMVFHSTSAEASCESHHIKAGLGIFSSNSFTCEVTTSPSQTCHIAKASTQNHFLYSSKCRLAAKYIWYPPRRFDFRINVGFTSHIVKLEKTKEGFHCFDASNGAHGDTAAITLYFCDYSRTSPFEKSEVRALLQNKSKFGAGGGVLTGTANRNSNTSSSASSSSSSSSTSKLDKAKATCTELGFTAGTEKHGNCVLKMMDN